MIIYAMVFFPLGWIPIPIFWKFGFAQDPITLFKRDDDVTAAAKWGRFYTVFFVVMPFAYRAEQWFHRRFGWLKFQFYKGNGCKETYTFIAALIALPLMFAVWAVYIGLIFGREGLIYYWDFLCAMVHPADTLSFVLNDIYLIFQP